MVIESQTGSSFIDGMTSYLRFKVIFTGATVPGSQPLADFGIGSALNLFDTITIRSKTGEEISRLEGASLAQTYIQYYENPNDSFNTILQAQGYPSGVTTIGNGGLGTSTSMTQSAGGVASSGWIFVIPAYILSPFFKQHKLLPPQVMSGLRMEFRFASVASALTSVPGIVGSPDGFLVSQIELRMDAYTIADQFARRINEMAASQGLSLIHEELYRTINSSTASTFDFDVKRAVSRALQVYTISRIAANVDLITADSVLAEPFLVSQYQHHVGSTYWPNSKMVVEASSQYAVNESYYYNLSTWQMLESDMAPNVSPVTYFTKTTSNAGSLCTTGAFLGKNTDEHLSGGIILNNSRALIAQIVFSTSVSRRLDTYLRHLRAVTCFTSNIQVRD